MAQQYEHGQTVRRMIAGVTAQCCYFLIRNHPWADGDKRTGFLAMMQFLNKNGFHADFEDSDAIAIGEGVASGAIGRDDLAESLYPKPRALTVDD